MKKTLAILLALTMVLVLLPGVALAAVQTHEVDTFDKLMSALNMANDGDTIKLTNDIAYTDNGTGLLNITKSITLDGDGHKISGYGNRGGRNTTLTINNDNSSYISVTLRNLTIENNAAPGRAVETIGQITELKIENCNLLCTGTSNNQVLTVTGNQSDPAEIKISDSTFTAGNSGYPVILFNSVNMTIENSNINGYCGVYFKSTEGSTDGSEGSTVTATGSEFNCPNEHSSADNDFGVFPLEDKNITISLTDCIVNATSTWGGASQYVVAPSSEGETFTLSISGDDTNVTGTILNSDAESAVTSKKSTAKISGGTFSVEPDAKLLDTNLITVTNSDGKHQVVSGVKQGNIVVMPAELNFGTREAGYTSVAPKTITIANTAAGEVEISCSEMADYDVTISKVDKEVAAQALTGDGNEADSNSVTLNNGEEAIISINPKNGLSAGNHDATLMISVNGDEWNSSSGPGPFNVPLKFTVTASTSTGSGISLWYNGGNSFGSSRSATPTAVEIDGKAVSFTGTGREFTVSCVPADAKWVTVRWYSTTVTTNFTPDANASCAAVAIPKTGDMTIWAAIAEFFGF